MRKIFNKPEQRRIDFVEFLNFRDNFAKKNDILDSIDIKELSLKSDIEYLNENYRDIFYIELMQDEVKINYHNNCSIEAFFKKILANHPISKMIEVIFFDKPSSIEELAGHLFTSVSTIYRQIEKFNEISQPIYWISIDTKSLNFLGREHDIRGFFAQYFAERYSIYEWPFEEYINSKKDLSEFILEACKIMDIKVSYSELETVTNNIAINVVRAKQGHNKNCPYCNDSILMNFDSLFKNSEKIQNLSEKLNLPFEPDYLKEIFSTYIHKDYVHDFDRILEKAEENAQFLKCLLYTTTLSYFLVRKYEIKLVNLDKLAANLNNALVLFGTEPYSNYIIYDRFGDYIKNIQNRFPEFVGDLCDKLKTFLVKIKGEAKPRELNYITYVTLNTWIDLFPQLEEDNFKAKVLIVSRFNSNHAGSINEQIKFYLSPFADSSVYDGDILDIEELEKTEADLIIADFLLPDDFKIPWSYIHGQRTIHEYISIVTKIHKIIKERNINNNI